MEGYILEFLISAFGVSAAWMGRRVIGRLDNIHSDLINLTIDHGERIVKLEVEAHSHHRKGDYAT